MEKLKLIKCKECIFFYGDEYKVNIHFLFPEEIKKMNFTVDQSNNIYTIDETIKMCHHPNCYIRNMDKEFKITAYRMKGQKQLNYDGKCPRFKYKKRYKLLNNLRRFFTWT